MLYSQYENLKQKPRMVPFLSVLLQIVLVGMFCSGVYTVYGVGFTIENASNNLSAAGGIAAAPTFQGVATAVMSLLYLIFAVRIICNLFKSWRSASVVKKLFLTEEVDVLLARERIGKLVLVMRSTVHASLVFLCLSRLLSVYTLSWHMIRSLFFVLLMCALVEAKSFSYIQGKRGAFSFGKSLCGYLLGVLTVVAVFNLKEKTLYDFAIGLLSIANGSLPKTALDWAYFLQANVIVYLAPLCFVIGLFRPFRSLFRKTKNIAGTEPLKRAANFYLSVSVLFLVVTCVLFGMHDGAVDYRYYLELVGNYLAIIILAVLVKLFSAGANRRFRFPVKVVEMPVGERHTLD